MIIINLIIKLTVKSQEFKVYNYVKFIYDKGLIAFNYSKLNTFNTFIL